MHPLPADPLGRACPACRAPMRLHAAIEGVRYDACTGCGSIVAEDAFLAKVADGSARPYDDDYWRMELAAAEERCFGASLLRVAELFILARRPIRRFLDISCGSGRLLDSLTSLLPGLSPRLHGIEPFPPPPAFRTAHPNYRVGFLGEAPGPFDAGICIEVIEHIPPAALPGFARDLRAVSAEGAIWYLNSSQPHSAAVREEGYLDPHRRGHIASWSVEGLRAIFGPAGFTVQPIPGRDYGVLLLRGEAPVLDALGLLSWVWAPHPENLAMLRAEPYGALFQAMGVEGAAGTLQAALNAERTRWAQGLSAELEACRAELRSAREQAEAAKRGLPAVFPARRRWWG